MLDDLRAQVSSEEVAACFLCKLSAFSFLCAYIVSYSY